VSDNQTSDDKRQDRQIIELLNELRVALPGVQILFAFLLTVPFSNGWQKVTSFQRNVYFVTLIATLVSTAFLIAPSAAHRVRFHKHDRVWLIESANRRLLAGLVALAVALASAVLLVADFIFNAGRAWGFAAATLVGVVALWFIRPLLRA
jgi:hypothetical protein